MKTFIVAVLILMSMFLISFGSNAATYNCKITGQSQVLDNEIRKSFSKGKTFGLVANEKEGLAELKYPRHNWKSLDSLTIPYKFTTISIEPNINYYFAFIKPGKGNGGWPNLESRGSVEVHEGRFRLIEKGAWTDIYTGECKFIE